MVLFKFTKQEEAEKFSTNFNESSGEDFKAEELI